jgi:hypothetical protein
MAFNDGEPLDAAKLGALELQVNNLASSIPKIGASTTNVSISNNTTPAATNIPQIVASAPGDKWELTPGKVNEKNFSFNGAVSSQPRAVLITSRHSGSGTGWHPQINTKTQSISKDGFTAVVYMPSSAPAHTVYITWLAICY